MNQSADKIFSIISLGCPKNTVDSERIIGMMVQAGFMLAEEPCEADLCLVNTCGFIAPARAEVAEVLEELVFSRDDAGTPAVIVAVGCLVEHARKHPELSGMLAQTDALVGFGSYMNLPEICTDLLEKKQEQSECLERQPSGGRLPATFNSVPRAITGTGHSVCLKISEGCNNVCSFCAIPGIRGGQVSRKEEDIITEARQLIAAGAHEINIIAQDTSAYGMDLYGERRLAGVLQQLSALDFEGWFRLMYVYPGHLDDEILACLAADTRFCPYIDIPLQHISDPLLQSMNRKTSRREIETLLDTIRCRIPGVFLRTAFIVGYPGETETHFEELMAFVEQQQFDHMGVFQYSPEPGTRAGRLTDDVPAEVKTKRYEQLMELQMRISEQKQRALRGRIIPVMIDGMVEVEGGMQPAGRHAGQAWDIDGVVLLDSVPDCMPGSILPVQITDSFVYDLQGKVTSNDWKTGPKSFQ